MRYAFQCPAAAAWRSCRYISSSRKNQEIFAGRWLKKPLRCPFAVSSRRKDHIFAGRVVGIEVARSQTGSRQSQTCLLRLRDRHPHPGAAQIPFRIVLGTTIADASCKTQSYDRRIIFLDNSRRCSRCGNYRSDYYRSTQTSLEILPLVPVQGDEDEEHGGEAPH